MKCHNCDGIGQAVAWDTGDVESCETCEGTGEVQ